MSVGLPLPPVPTLVWLDEVDSTHRYTLDRFALFPHGLVVAARHQRAGRGRLGRRWHSPPGNVCLTAVAKPPHVSPTDELAGGLTLAMAVSACEVLEKRAIEPSLKWPNDVCVGQEKIAGVLAQAVWEGNRFAGAAVSLGLNVNMDLREITAIGRPATSLRVLTGRDHDPDEIARLVATRFLEWIGVKDPSLLRGAVIRRSQYLGTTLSVRTGCGEVTGRALALDRSFALVVADQEGREHTVQVGDVT